MTTVDDPWTRYGRTLTRAMAEVLDEIPEELRSHAITSGNPHRIARRAKNKIVGRALARTGL